MRKITSRSVVNGFGLAFMSIFVACGRQDVTKTEDVQASVLSENKEKVTSVVPENKVEKLPSGLIYEVLVPAKEGAALAEKGKMVTVHYTGWLSENGKRGTKFDSSVDRNDPFKFLLGAGYVIKGWDEGVAKMHVGEKCQLTIPADLGYGNRGAGRLIPPGATLIFEVELLKVG